MRDIVREHYGEGCFRGELENGVVLVKARVIFVAVKQLTNTTIW